ncbi:unnamed protein product, partial [marine sediment metagenome]
DFFSSDKTEYFNIIECQSWVQLTEFPLNSITTVAERLNYNSDYTLLTTAAFEYYYNTVTESVERTTTSGGGKYFPTGPAAVRVVYSAGYDTTVPEDLMLAVVDLITFYAKKERKERRIIGNTSISGAGESHLRGFTGFPDHITRVLNYYRAE